MEPEAEQKVEVPSLYEFSANEEDYFVATNDSRRVTESLNINSAFLIDRSKGFVTFKNEHYCKFNGSYFSQFFFYHFMFYFVLGPLFPIIFLPIIGIPLMKNMGFWKLDLNFLFQLCNWVVIFCVILVLIINPDWNEEQAVVTTIDLYTIVTLMLLRIANISSKYATFTPEKMSYLKHNVATKQELSWDLLLGAWLQQSDTKILEEIESAVKRNEIDLNLLMVDFLRPPDSETMNRLMKKNRSFRERNEALFAKEQEGERSGSNGSMTGTEISIKYGEEEGGTKPKNNSIFGVAIIHDLIERYRDSNTRFRILVIICTVISLIRGAIPWLIYRSTNDLTTWETWAICILISIQTIWLYLQITIFFLMSTVDIRRKIFIETQLGYMVAPKKYGGVEGVKKIFPTTNFLSPKHLRGWNLLRKIGRDYGFRYSLREANNLGWAATIYVFFAVILALDFFGLVRLSYFVKDATLYRTLETTISFDVIIFFVLLIRTMMLGIKLNKFYRIHKNNFEELQIFLSDIARKIEWYFTKNLKPKNYLYKFTVDYFKDEKKEGHDEHVSQRLEDLLSTMREIAHDIEFEEAHRPFTVLGFEPSSNILSTIAIGAGSLTFAIGQYYFHKFQSG